VVLLTVTRTHERAAEYERRGLGLGRDGSAISGVGARLGDGGAVDAIFAASATASVRDVVRISSRSR